MRIEEVDGDPVDGRLPPGRGRERHGARAPWRRPARQRPSSVVAARIATASARCGWRARSAAAARCAAGFGWRRPGSAGRARWRATTMARPASIACADLQRAQRQQHVIAEAAGADHRGDDHHVERQHDDLVDADHQRRPRRRDEHAPQLLPRACSRPSSPKSLDFRRHARQRRAWSRAPSAGWRRWPVASIAETGLLPNRSSIGMR